MKKKKLVWLAVTLALVLGIGAWAVPAVIQENRKRCVASFSEEKKERESKGELFTFSKLERELKERCGVTVTKQ